ncbi:MAG: hypothetical protein IRZ16_22450 [Myxococcaceae bacterium]|nr:hypothetical protein [Myxococcaceae bacterium]
MGSIRGALVAAVLFGSSLALAGQGQAKGSSSHFTNCTCDCQQPGTGGAGQAGGEHEQKAEKKQGITTLGQGTWQDQKSGGSVKPGGNKTHSSITSAKRNQIPYPGRGGAATAGEESGQKMKKCPPGQKAGTGGSGNAGQSEPSNGELEGSQPEPYSSPGIRP